MNHSTMFSCVSDEFQLNLFRLYFDCISIVFYTMDVLHISASLDQYVFGCVAETKPMA